MRTAAFVAVLLVSAAFVALDTAKAEAISPTEFYKQPEGLFIDYDLFTKQNRADNEQLVSDAAIGFERTTEQEEKEDKRQKKPKVIRHEVESGETLTSIAEQYEIRWQRIYFKNIELSDPHSLEPGQKLTIPMPNEKLTKRPIHPIRPSASSASDNGAAATSQNVSTFTSTGSTIGNTYYQGYCTWYAKNRRPDLPNNLGNANTWVSRAAAQGFATGSTPRIGAVAQSRVGVHVAIVEKVNPNGTVVVSEMNYEGWNVVSSRTAPAAEFLYIY